MKPRLFSLLFALHVVAVPVISPVFAENAPSNSGLATAAVELREVDQTYPADAIVEAVRQASIAAQVTGRVIEARFDAGSRVKAGDVLMRIDPREARQLQSGAQAQLANASAGFERSKQLFGQKFISQAALDKAAADFKVASAGAGQAGTQTSFTTLTAPYAGVIAQRLAEVGEMAVPGKPLLNLYDPRGLRVVASIPQLKLADVRQAMRAKVEFPESGKWVDGLRVEVLPTADSQTHVVRARVYLPDNLEGVVPGMFVRAHFVLGKAGKLLVPAAAVVRRGEVTAVYVVDGQGLPHLRQVRVGEAVSSGGRPVLEVLAGLAAGEQVALDPVKAGITLKRGGH